MSGSEPDPHRTTRATAAPISRPGARSGPAPRGSKLVLAAVLFGWATAPVAAGPVLDRVKAANSVSCGAEDRPGVAEAGEDGTVTGLAVDLCRALAVAVLGTEGKIVFTVLDADKDIAAVRDGRQDVVFLSGGTLLAGHLADRLLPGPPAYIETESVMVPDASAVRASRDLAGSSVCFMIGTGAQRALEAAVERDGIAIKRMGFQEDVELRDAYNVGRCTAIAGDATFLAEVRRDGGVHGLKSRILDTPLALDPVFLMTGVEDARWSAMADWTLQALMLGSAPHSDWSGSGAEPLARAVTSLGFRAGWYGDVTRIVGSYDQMWRRNLGEGSDLKLAEGPNTAWPGGVVLAPSSP